MLVEDVRHVGESVAVLVGQVSGSARGVVSARRQLVTLLSSCTGNSLLAIFRDKD